MGNPYDLLVKQDAHVTEWSNISTHPDIASMSAAIDAKNTVTVNASGSVSAGSLVAFNDDGTVSMPYAIPAVSTAPVATGLFRADKTATSYDTIRNRWVVSRPGSGYYPITNSFTISGDSVVAGDTYFLLDPETPTYQIGGCYYDVHNFHVVAHGRFSTHTAYMSWGTMNSSGGMSMSISNITTDLDSLGFWQCAIEYDKVNEVAVLLFSEATGAPYSVYTSIVTIPPTGTAIDISAPQLELLDGDALIAGVENTLVYDSIDELFITSFGYNTISSGKIISGELVWNNPVEYYPTGTESMFITYIIHIPESRKVALSIKSASSGYWYVMIGEVNGSGFNFGDIVQITSSESYYTYLGYDTLNKKLAVTTDEGESVKVTEFLIDGVELTLIDSYIIDSSAIYGTLLWHSLEEKFIFLVNQSDYSMHTGILELSSSSMTTNFIGIAQNDALHGQPVTVGTLGFMDEQQTGLTVPERYYSDPAGNLTTSGAVKIGKSSSTTDLIITE